MAFKTERTIYFICLVVCIVSIYHLLDDSWIAIRNRVLPSAAPIGHISYLHENVRIKNEGEIVWWPAKHRQSVYRWDSVYTGKDSRVNIEFSKGEVLKLDENTLIRISKDESDEFLKLEQGSLRLSLGLSNNIKLKSPDNKTVEIEGKSLNLKVSTDHNNNMQMKVLSGTGRLISGEKKRNLDVNKEISINTKSNEIISRQFRVQTFSPKDGQLFWKSAKVIKFLIKSDNKTAKRRLILSQHPDLSVPILERTFLGDQTVVKCPESAGDFFWKVKIEGEDADSSVSKFSLLEMKEPILEYPIQGNEFEYQNSRFLVLHWSKGNGLSEVEISPSKAFEKDTKKFKTLYNRLSLENWQAGTYFWRVRHWALGELEEKSVWSSVGEFSIPPTEKKSPANEEKPGISELSTPKVESRYGYQKFSTFRNPEKVPVVFAWSEVQNAQTYYLEISSDSEFREVVFSKTVTNTKLKVDLTLTKGLFYWRVRAQSGKIQSTMSDPQRVEVSFVNQVPAVEGLRYNWQYVWGQNNDLPLTVEWEKIQNAEGYLVEVLPNDSSIERVRQQVTPITSVQLGLNPLRSYRVRVTPILIQRKPAGQKLAVERKLSLPREISVRGIIQNRFSFSFGFGFGKIATNQDSSLEFFDVGEQNSSGDSIDLLAEGYAWLSEEKPWIAFFRIQLFQSQEANGNLLYESYTIGGAYNLDIHSKFQFHPGLSLLWTTTSLIRANSQTNPQSVLENRLRLQLEATAIYYPTLSWYLRFGAGSIWLVDSEGPSSNGYSLFAEPWYRIKSYRIGLRVGYKSFARKISLLQGSTELGNAEVRMRQLKYFLMMGYEF